jgi:subtilase family serine protease
MKRTTGRGARVGSLAMALLITTPGLAQERALTLEGQRFVMHGMELSQARGEGHRPMTHARVCARAAATQGFASCHARVVKDETGQPFATTGPAGYSPTDLRTAYSVTGNGTSATVIAIVDAFGYPNAESDLATYRAQFGLPACTTANGCFKKVNQNGVQGNYPRANTGWSQETALDLDMVSAMCPGCSILLVEANDSSLANLAAAVNRAAAMGAHAISNSYGGGETGTQNTEQLYNYAGIAVTASSGDGGFGVEFPAASPHVTAVGGTSLTRSNTARGFTETAWDGAGSGCSAVYAKPTWQTDTGCPRRTVADVSAVADPNTGVAVFAPSGRRNRSAWLVFGGTSVAAPLIAGLYGVNDTAVNHGSDPYRHTANLNDVTSGSNGTCTPTYLCTAVVGYDGPTGLGTPNGVAAFGF